MSKIASGVAVNDSVVAQGLRDALASAITKATAGVGSAIDFLSGQIPDVIHQLLLWEFAKSFLWFAVAAVVFLLCLVSLITGLKNNKSWLWEDAYWKPSKRTISPTILIPILSGCAGFAGMFTHLTWLQIWIAPKIFLIEYMAAVVKNHM